MGSNNKKKTEQDIIDILPTELSIEYSTYINANTKAKFIDIDFGEFWMVPAAIWNQGQGHPTRGKIKQKTNNIKKFGGPSPAASKEVRAKMQSTTMERFGFNFASQSQEIKDKKCATSMNNYGVPYPIQHPDVQARVVATCLERYGFNHHMNDPVIAKKSSMSGNTVTQQKHWKTGEVISCKASYERLVVEYLNQNQIDFQWQIPFRMPDGRLYICDLYIKSENKYVEIKGWMRESSKVKWDWFKSEYPSSELWSRKELKMMGIILK